MAQKRFPKSWDMPSARLLAFISGLARPAPSLPSALKIQIRTLQDSAIISPAYWQVVWLPMVWHLTVGGIRFGIGCAAATLGGGLIGSEGLFRTASRRWSCETRHWM
jgi:hypothetical protein